MRCLPTLSQTFILFLLFLAVNFYSRLGFAANVFKNSEAREAFMKKSARRHHFESTSELIQSTGYDVEKHNVVTDDGYILSVYRIPGGPKSPRAPRKPAVLAIHGILVGSDYWVLRGPGEDLVYILSDEGYDVWLLNFRGNFYSRRHKKLSPESPKFWRFSWHEYGVYDTTATIDYILGTTGLDKLSLIGHSMGGTVQLVLLSMKPEYNDKINVAISFAPVAVLTHTLPGPVFSLVAQYGEQIQHLTQLLGIHELLPRNPVHFEFYSALCQNLMMENFCQKLLFFLLGFSETDRMDIDVMSKLTQHCPQGTSVETLFHYRQIIVSGKFQQYDFGPEKNLVYYNNTTPPEYPLHKVTAPVILYYGPNDVYTTEKDVLAMNLRLPNAIPRKVPLKTFSHIDFLFSKTANQILYGDVIEMLINYDDRINETRP